ncbi:hypothetical protein TPHA_0N00510 [Tetrapisispora phaffii CBS 4417]|uniref:DNA polymerase gamma n=1 Tax=Tetrapisispora phaffii (strain ATCC 24235 / CBS 4417 / NBRC 1672 / NRRL Y-8282 / UCD 70-5) TaxID=1071381 RepID=G8C103_TETPH|nr:hypothetical protein TPHA_0N00510 [Tetrapisispora phaffii CBS 4417]CCE65831.1 hypothetical protein TPHA_0N00510 [Tetrapisispora phaffii CBS 4417]
MLFNNAKSMNVRLTKSIKTLIESYNTLAHNTDINHSIKYKYVRLSHSNKVNLVRKYSTIINNEQTSKLDNYENFNEKPRINPVGIQYLSNSLHNQVFGSNKISKKESKMSAKEKEQLIDLSKLLLKNHGLLNKKTKIEEPISFELPKLQGNSLDEHFQKIGGFVSDPFKQKCESKFKKLLPKPDIWLFKSGWYRYELGNSIPKKVAYPLEDTLVFDVETLYNISDYATLATAVSNKAWYCWVSPFLTGESRTYKHLIPLNTLEQEKLIIGHNVAYDRARVLEEYNFKPSKSFFFDTQSLHVASSGLCSRQRPAFIKNKKRKQKSEEENIEVPENDALVAEDPWLDVASMNSLSDVALLHCNIKMDKNPRDFFASKDKQEIVDNFQHLVNYCATDVEVTSKVFDKVFPLYMEKCPHPISFGALVSLSSCILPTKYDEWKNYINNSEGIYQESKNLIEKKIKEIMDEVVNSKDDPNFQSIINNDPWLRQLDWTIKPVRMSKKTNQPSIKKLPGYPEWYRALFPTQESKDPKVTIRTRIVPLLFKLSWEGQPVVWTKMSGWCFPVEKQDVENMKKKNYLLADDIAIQAYNEELIELDPKAKGDTVLFKVPHPNGPEFNCTSLLSKPYIHYFEKNIMTSRSQHAHEALKINSSASYWISARERIMSQFVVKKEDFSDQFQTLPSNKTQNSLGDNTSIILPPIIPMGTVTRRAVEKTWLTASNAKKNRIGSELKAKIVAPDGYCFVGADVDSEELWIASLVGDSVFNVHGGTAIGWMCLEGTKNEGTDLHTKTADLLGCSRNEAKIFNYGRIYGAGVKFASLLLKNFNPTLSEQEAKEAASNLYANTKGQSKTSKIFKRFWFGGSESILFNKLENIANQEVPRTPVLGCGITSSLMKQNLNINKYLPSRINWAIQSSGVDYLHLLCCSMSYLIKKYGINARLCISIHDEIRFLVSEEDKYKAAMALQVSNIWTRAMFCEQIGIDDLPQNCAFFSAVDIDKVLRKEVDMDCITPSNNIPIPHGESLTITDLLKIPSSMLRDPDPDIRVEKFSYKYRDSVFSNYNRAYSKEFSKFYLKMQILDSKWKVTQVENEYIEYERTKSLSENQNKPEYGLLDFMHDIKTGKRKKASIMENQALIQPNLNDNDNKRDNYNLSNDYLNASNYSILHEEILKPTSILAQNDQQAVTKNITNEGKVIADNEISLNKKSITKSLGSQKSKKQKLIRKKSFDLFHQAVGKSQEYINERQQKLIKISTSKAVEDILREPVKEVQINSKKSKMIYKNSLSFDVSNRNKSRKDNERTNLVPSEVNSKKPTPLSLKHSTE